MTEINPFQAQRVFIDPKERSKRYYGYISGVGAGKTFAGIVRTMHNMLDWNPGEMGAIIAPTRQMIVNVIIPEMREIGLFDPPTNWEYKSAYSDQPGIHAPNGSRALILSADNKQTIERLRGLNLSWVWIDEKTAVPARAQEIAMQRLRTGEYRNLYVTTTPKGKDDTYDFFVGDVDAEKTVLEQGTLYETEDRRAIVGVPTSANPHTPEDYKDAMEADLPEDVRAQEVQGEFVELGGGVYTPGMWNWADPEYVAEAKVTPVMGIDPAATADAGHAEDTDSDYWAVTVAYKYSRKNKLYVADTSQRRGMTLSEGVEWLHSIVQQIDQQPEIVVEANQSQRWLQQKLGERGIPAAPVQTTRGKEDKLIDLSIPVSDGTVQFIDWSGDNDDFTELRNQMLSFPDASHDDLMDSLALVVNHSNLGGTSIFGGSYGGDDDEW